MSVDVQIALSYDASLFLWMLKCLWSTINHVLIIRRYNTDMVTCPFLYIISQVKHNVRMKTSQRLQKPSFCLSVPVVIKQVPSVQQYLFEGKTITKLPLAWVCKRAASFSISRVFSLRRFVCSSCNVLCSASESSHNSTSLKKRKQALFYAYLSSSYICQSMLPCRRRCLFRQFSSYSLLNIAPVNTDFYTLFL